MRALESLLRPVASMINRQITAKSPARDLCTALTGRVMALRVKNTALAIYLVVAEDKIDLSADYNEDPDVVVSGTLLGLTRLAGPDSEAVIRDGDVELMGKADIAEQFQKLLRYGRPDFEEELAGVVGDVAAHGVGNFVRKFGDWGRNAGETMQQNVGEYLREESQAVPTRDEVDTFRDQVNALRDDVARFEARLKTAESRSAPQEST